MTSSRRWRPSFSLRTLIVAMLVGGPLLGWLSKREYDRRHPVLRAKSSPALTMPVGSHVRALGWLARHQQPDGSWSTQDFHEQCQGDRCPGTGKVKADTAATAAALLTFLATGKTHNNKSQYEKNIRSGVLLLIKNQQDTGSLSAGADDDLSGHSLATIVLSECYAMTADATLARPAQKAIDFIQSMSFDDQAPWQYQPGQTGDSTPLVWQMLALKSGRKNGLNVDATKFTARAKWLLAQALAADKQDLAAAAAGLLAAQVLEISPDNDVVELLVRRLLAALPDSGKPRDCVAQLFATIALYASSGEPWRTWHDDLRKVVPAAQCRTGCADGSWSPTEPMPDAWGEAGGREYVTAMSMLSLLVYYRHLPQFDPRPPR